MKTQPQPISPDGLAGIDAIVLCGGKGTRLQSVISDRPKMLADVGGRPFLDMLIDRISAAGVKRVILSVGYMRDQITARYARTDGIFFAEEEKPLGTGGGVKNAESFLTGEDVLVMNGDSFISGPVDLAAFYRFHKEHGADITMMLAQPRDEKDYGVVTIDAEGKISRFHEKADDGSVHYMSAGIYMMKRDLFGRMPQDAFSLETDFFPSLVGGAFFGFPIEGKVVDIGTPERYKAAQGSFLS